MKLWSHESSKGIRRYVVPVPDRYLDLPPLVELPPPATLLLALYPADTSPPGVEMLGKIAQACGLTPDVDAVANPVAGQIDLVSILRDAPVGSRPRYVVAYGLSPAQIGAAWAPLRYVWIDDGPTAFCFTEGPDVIAADMSRKKTLWATLKRIEAERSGRET